jgi:hypothetical protein
MCSDGQVIAEVIGCDEVAIGQVVGWPSAEQYERAGRRALAMSSAIRKMERNTPASGEISQKDCISKLEPVCPHCGHKHTRPHELDFGDGSKVTIECEHCVRAFVVEIVVAAEYSTYKSENDL